MEQTGADCRAVSQDVPLRLAQWTWQMGPEDRERPYTPGRAGALKQRAVQGNPAEKQGVLLQPASGQHPNPSLIPLELLDVLPCLAFQTVWPRYLVLAWL